MDPVTHIFHTQLKKFDLPDFSHITATGPDAPTFLHGQLTNNLVALPENQWQISAWCNPQGRIKTVLWLWREQEDVHLIVPQSMTKRFLDDIKRYVLRARVHFEHTGYRVIAQIGLKEATKVFHWTKQNNDRVLGYHPHGSLLLSEKEQDDNEAQVSSSYWYAHLWSCGYAWILPELSETIIPQAAGFREGKGLDFNKGCYPGQEIIARLHHRGQNKRHLYRCQATAAHIPVGTKIFYQNQDVGVVVNHGTTDQKEQLLLCTLIDEKAETAALTVQEKTLNVITRVA